MSALPMQGGSVWAIVVTYNAVLDNVLHLGKALAPQVEKVLIIDNGSVNAAELRAACHGLPQIELICSPDNLGIATAQNIAVKAARAAGTQFLVYFDQDSRITENFVPTLKHAFITLSGTEKIAATVPVFKDVRHGFFYPMIWLNRYGSRTRIIPQENSVQPFRVSMAISSGTFTSMAVMDEVGAMRDDFFIDYVDIEWCLRALNKGYAIFAVPSVCMLHAIGDQSIPFFKWRLVVHGAIRRYYRVRNSFFLLRLAHVPATLAFREITVNILQQIILLIIKGDRKRNFSYFMRAIADGLRNLKG